MKNKTLFSILLVLLLTLTIVGCKKPVIPKETITPIVDLLQTGTNNQNVIVEGVIYGKNPNGFYVSDSTLGKIYVTYATAANIGDKVKVTGVFGITDNVPRIKNVSNVAVTASNQTLPAAESMSVEEIAQLSHTAKTGSYGRYVSVVVTIESDVVNTYLKSDLANSLIISNVTNVSLLDASKGKRVTMPVILHEYNTQDLIWRVSFANASSDIVETPISFASLVTRAMEHINNVVPANIYGALVLPSVHPTVSYLTYTWTVAANEYVSITDGLVNVLTDSADHQVVFTVTITNGTETQTRTVNVTSKAIVEREVGEFVTNKPTMDGSAVLLHGVVVAFTRNQSLTLRSVILKDMATAHTMSVDFADIGANQILQSSSAFMSLELGDEILVRGTFRTLSRQTIHTVTSLEVLSSNNSFTHDTTNAYVLNSKETYENFANNYDDYANKLVKFENPFMNYSTSTPPTVTNWVRLGYSETSANAKHDGTHVFAILIAANNETTGSDKWHRMFNIPLLNDPAQQFGGSFYAYAMYVSDSYIAFVVPGASQWGYQNQLSVEFDLGALIPSSLEEGEVVLPTTHPNVTGTVSWSSSNETLISSTTGIVSGVETNTVVTLSAVYTYEGKQYTSTYEVTILGTEALSISKVLKDAEDGAKVKVKGIFVAYQSDGNANVARDGIILLDEATGELLLVNAMAQTGGTYGAYMDSYGNLLEFGHEVQIVGTYYVNTLPIGTTGPVQTGRKYLEITSDSIVKRLSDVKKTIDWKTTNALTITTNDELTALANNVAYGRLIKLVGTKDNPIYIGGSSSADYPKINIKVFKTPAVDNNATKYDGQTFSLKNDVNTPNASATWLKDLFGIEAAFVGPSGSIPAKPYVGTLYVVIGARTSTYYQMSLVNYSEATISKIYTQDEINTSLVTGLPATVEAGDIDFTLPTTHPVLSGSISWVSSNPEIVNLGTNKIAMVAEDTQVTLTGSYTLYDEALTVEHVILVQASADLGPKQVSAVLTTGVENMEVEVVGLLAAYQGDGNNNIGRDGIILIDKANGSLLLVNGLGQVNGGTYGAYKDQDGKALEIGNEVIISGIYHVNTAAVGSGPAQTGRKYLEVTATSIVTKVSDTKHVIPWDKENAINITKDADLVGLSNNLEYGKLIKIVGTTDNPIQIGGSSTTLATTNFKFFMNNATDNEGTKYNGQTFSLKNDLNGPNATTNWAETLFGVTAAFVGPTAAVPAKLYTGTIYAVLAWRTGTYYQLILVNYQEATSSKMYTQSEINTSLVTGLPATVEAGDIDFTLPTTHPVLTGSISWVSSNPEVINLDTQKIVMVAEDTQVTLTGSYTLYGKALTVEHVILVQASADLGPKQVSALLTTGVENMEVEVVGLLAAYQGDGNNTAARDGIILIDKVNGSLLLVNGLGLVNGGTHGAYKDKDGKALEIGNEVIISGIYHLDTEAVGTGPAQTGRKHLEVTATSIVTKVSDTKHTIPWDKANAINITKNADLVGLSNNLEYGKLIKIVGTTENPIQIGSSSSTLATANFKFFMNNATDNNATKYNGQTFSFKNDLNAHNASTTWAKDLFGITAGFVGPTATVPAKSYTGTIYAVLAWRTGTYYQLILVNYQEATASPVV